MKTDSINTSSFFMVGQNRSNAVSDNSDTDFQSIMKQTSYQGNHSTKSSDISTSSSTKANDQDQNTAQTTDDSKRSSEVKKDTKDSDVKDVASKDEDTESTSEVSTAETEDSEEDTEDVTVDAAVLEMLGALQDNIKDIVTTKLGVSSEELDQVLKELGLGVEDLLNQNQLAKVVAKLTEGTDDVSTLLLNEDAFQSFAEISNELGILEESTLEQLNVTEEELTGLLKQFNQEVDTDVQPVNDFANLIDSSSSKDQQALVNEQTDSFDMENGISTTDKQVLEKNANVSDEDDSEGFTVATEIETEVDSENSLSTEEKPVLKEEPVTAPNGTVGQLQQDITSQSLLAEDPKEVLSSYLDAKDIIDQITEQIKVTVNEDTSKMEMQLYPEHLGKVTIQVAVKEGSISAQITAQNEAVKEIMESQIVQLREKMDAQGLKVDAVEVTLESHGFERNLDQNREDSNSQSERQTSSRRSISLGGIDELSDLSEEEELIANIMAGNGNTVDYTA